MLELVFEMYFLGIDGGATTTRCALGDETCVLATASAGGSNVIRLGEAQVREALHSVIKQACSGANISPDQIQGICIGAAGAAREEVANVIRRFISELTPAPVTVVGDMVTALEAAVGSGAGVITNAGTGSFAYGRNDAGNTARAGGWGFAISDEGSGQWIGREAVSAVLRAEDSGTKTALRGLILREWKLNSLDELVRGANATPPPEFPRLFPLAVRAAEGGDQEATALLQRAGTHLAGLAAMVIGRLLPRPPHAPVAITGSVFRQSAIVRQVFYNDLEGRFPGIQVRTEPVEPVSGALALARKMGAQAV